jgi:hypothetical protein
MRPHFAVHRFSVIAVLALCGCASAPTPPGNPVEAAANAVARAEDARASDYAPEEMRVAHEKLRAAQALSRQEASSQKNPNAVKARWLAEEASADAALAEAKAQDIRDQSVLREMQHTAPAAVVPPAGGE